jgi:23S rRNA G2445 N2-methylase RlmL
MNFVRRSFTTSAFSLRVNCAPGLETVLKRELNRIGVGKCLTDVVGVGKNIRVGESLTVETNSVANSSNATTTNAKRENGGVEFRCSESEFYNVLLRSRVADSAR